MFHYLHARKLIERASLTPEGFVYVTVLCFITIGSVIRNVNLLILMAGLMYAPLFINWRLAVRRLRSFRANRSLPNRVHANRLVSFQWECENVLPGMAAYNVAIEDQISRSDEQTSARGLLTEQASKTTLMETWFSELIHRLRNRGLKPGVSPARLRYRKLSFENPESQSYRIFFSQRGKYVVRNATVSTSFPFGLIISRNFIDQDQTFFVAPELGRLEPTWEQRVQSTAVGSDSIRRRRSLEEDEFYALRPWRSGDSKKNIHWRTTARLCFPMVKQHDQQNNRDFAIVLDLHAETDDQQAKNRAETVLSFAATAILAIGRDVQGQVAVSICGRELEVCRSRTPQGLISEVMPELAVAQTQAEPEVEKAIVETISLVSSGTPVYVVSTRALPESMTAESIGHRAESPQASTGDKSRLRRLKSALPLVRWLDVRSDDFQSVFTREMSDSSVPERAVIEVKQLTSQLETP